MTLPEHTLQYHKYTKVELRAFVMQRQNLSGREFKKSSKRDLVRRLLRLDQIATFRLLDLPPEVREQCFQNAIARASNFGRLLLVSKQVHIEVRWLFYKDATFNIGFLRPDCPSRATGNPMFGMSTRYWSHVSAHESPLRISFANTLLLQHHMFRNIRHLTLKGGIMQEMTAPGAIRRRFRVGGSRLLFLTCVFYAFSDYPTQLKTLQYRVEGHIEPSVLTAKGVYSAFWPLQLLARRVRVELGSMSKELVDPINNKSELGFQVMEACQRFAKCYFSHNRPSVAGKSYLLEDTRTEIYREKMAELAAFSIPIFPQEIWRLRNFVKRMEWMEAEYLDHAEEYRSWSLTRAWVEINGSPPRRV